jgi:hypothetical protein
MYEAFSDRTLSFYLEAERTRDRLLQERSLGALLEDLPSQRLLKAVTEAERERDALLRLTESPLEQLRATEPLLSAPFSAYRDSVEQLRRTVEAVMPTHLPGVLDRFAPKLDELAYRGLFVPSSVQLADPVTLGAFAESTAVARALASRERVDRELLRAVEQYRLGSLPAVDSLHAYGRFLDAAGLALPHWPGTLTGTLIVLRRKRLGRKLHESRPAAHIKRAQDLNHRYEQVLRLAIDEAMAAEYGDDWAGIRLELCGCKGLLGRWRARGGEPLDHADFAHYKLIMTHPEHFSRVFAAGFDDPQELATLIDRAGQLRAASHHGRAFSEENLRELRLTWRTLQRGLEQLIDPYGDDADLHG